MPRASQVITVRPPEPGWPRWLVAGAVVAGVVAAFANSLHGPFIFDDIAAVGEDNPTIRDLGDLAAVLSPPAAGGQTVGGRPLANLTLAVNYAFGGRDPRGYHLVNLGLHLAAVLTLFALVAHTLRHGVRTPRWREAALPLAGLAALLWGVHPLQTESVTYVVQRVESLAGLAVLLTVYGVARGARSRRPWPWTCLAVGASWCGVASKEVAAVAPLLALLYDRTFIAGGFREAWRRRRSCYLAMAGSWLLLGFLVVDAGGRGGTAGFVPWPTWLAYLGTQAWAVTRYLRLAVLPTGQVFDYGPYFTTDPVTLAWSVTVILILLGATAWALVRRPVLGFLGASFLLVLAPSALVPVTVQTVAEHRMYLPLAAVVTLGVVAGYRLLDRWVMVPGLAAALALGVATHLRNAVYASDLAVWSDVVRHWPGNARAHASLGTAQAARGDGDAAIASLREALRLESAPGPYRTHTNLAVIHANLASALMGAGQADEAMGHFAAALQEEPGEATVHANFGTALLQRNRPAESIVQFQAAVQLNPRSARAESGWGDALVQCGRPEEAVGHYETALALAPDSPDTLNNLGGVCFQLGRYPEAEARYVAALRLDPRSAQTFCNLGNVHAVTGRAAEAISCYERALALDPALDQAAHNLALLREATRAP